MAIQLIRLTQIKANLPQFMDFEQQLAAMFGSDDTFRVVASAGQQTIILNRDYRIGRNALKVFVNGMLQSCSSTDGYIELNSRMIAFTEGLVEGDVVTVLFNNLTLYASQMAKNRVAAYDIYRQTHFVTDQNVNVLTLSAPTTFTPGLNQLKVFANGLSLTVGQGYDYVENSDNTFTLNRTFAVGTTITSEVTTGGLSVYKCDVFPIFIDLAKSSQNTFVLPMSYKVGGNNLKVYLNGQLLRAGASNDYIEASDTSFVMNRPLPIGSILKAEITTFTVDVFDIVRSERLITEANKTQVNFMTVRPYRMGESNLRVYLNGVLLREGVNEDYVEVDTSNFSMNYTELPVNSILEYEIISW